MEYNNPLVSVVIPTFNRPNLLVRALKSAFMQTLDAIEVIVVMDGPDEATLQILQTIRDPRLQVRTLSQHGGAPDARNAGVSEARSRWIAFLDDDDEWLPQKLELQLNTAQRSHHRSPIITCRLTARTESEKFIWPRSVLRNNESLSEYLFCLKSLKGPFFGEGLIQTSTIFTTKELLQKIPFTRSLPGHQDADWLLRAGILEGVFVEFVPENAPLVIWHIEENRKRIGTSMNDWRFFFIWAQANRHLMTPHAYASYLMISISGVAERTGEWKAFLLLLWNACRDGKPKIIDLFAYFIIWLIPRNMRRQIGQWLNKNGHS
jgi:glycosyltransferase involved in cell wall biosynthesis